jgi:hypothetical protein
LGKIAKLDKTKRKGKGGEKETPPKAKTIERFRVAERKNKRSAEQKTFARLTPLLILMTKRAFKDAF